MKQGDGYCCRRCGRTRAYGKFTGRAHAGYLGKNCERPQRQ